MVGCRECPCTVQCMPVGAPCRPPCSSSPRPCHRGSKRCPEVSHQASLRIAARIATYMSGNTPVSVAKHGIKDPSIHRVLAQNGRKRCILWKMTKIEVIRPLWPPLYIYRVISPNIETSGTGSGSRKPVNLAHFGQKRRVFCHIFDHILAEKWP